MSKHIIVFAKNPELGKVKTRLAATIGKEKALEAYKHLLKHTEDVIKESNIPCTVYFTSDTEEPSVFNDHHFNKALQIEGNLGEKMSAAFQDQFQQGVDSVVIIGTDCYSIQATHIQEAFIQLVENDFVIGPANDGGYYLLGMKEFCPEIFDGINWSTETVLEETLSRIKSMNKKTVLLEELVDVDHEHELGTLRQLIFNS